MKEFMETIKKVELFGEMDVGDIETLLNCLGYKRKNVCKGEIVLLAGQTPRHVGIVLRGALHIVREDFDGNRTILAVTGVGDIFAEALCCANVAQSPVTVVADIDSVVMLLEFSKILHTCKNSCAFHVKLIENMLKIIAAKNLLLQRRMEIVCLKSIRTKVLRYLESFSAQPNSEIVIPFNREELANFLNVERSALSHELARMKRDRLITYKKNRFMLILIT